MRRTDLLGTATNLEESLELSHGYQPQTMTQREKEELDATINNLNYQRVAEEIRPTVAHTIEALRTIIAKDKFAYLFLRRGLTDEVVRHIYHNYYE